MAELASLVQKTACTLYTFCSLVYSLLQTDTLFKNIFDFTTAGEWGRDVWQRLSVSLSFSIT